MATVAFRRLIIGKQSLVFSLLLLASPLLAQQTLAGECIQQQLAAAYLLLWILVLSADDLFDGALPIFQNERALLEGVARLITIRRHHGRTRRPSGSFDGRCPEGFTMQIIKLHNCSTFRFVSCMISGGRARLLILMVIIW